MKHFNALALLAALLVGGAVGACQSPSRVVSAEASPVCPDCRDETRLREDGTHFVRHVCPSCRSEAFFDEALPDSEVHVCDRCKISVKDCPQCLRQ